MQVNCRDACSCELSGELLRLVLGAHEEHRAAHAGRELDDDCRLVGCRHGEHVMLHVGGRRIDRVDGMGDRIIEVALDEYIDTAIEGGREQQALALIRRAIHQSLDAGQEAEVSHVIGLVENSHLDHVELAMTLGDQILKTTGAGNDDVGAGLEGSNLLTLADAAIDGRALEAHGVSQRFDHGEHLIGELTGRYEHEATRASRCALLAGKCGNKRNREGKGLARAGAATAEHIAAGEAIGESRGLDREAVDKALLGEGVDKGKGNAEFGKGIHVLRV